MCLWEPHLHCGGESRIQAGHHDVTQHGTGPPCRTFELEWTAERLHRSVVTRKLACRPTASRSVKGGRSRTVVSMLYVSYYKSRAMEKRKG